MRAVVFEEYGDQSVLQVKDLPAPEPGPGEVLVLVQASGVNFMDVYQRTGTYQVGLPFTLGSEGAGTVLRFGDGVEGLSPVTGSRGRACRAATPSRRSSRRTGWCPCRRRSAPSRRPRRSCRASRRTT
ncbi:MDR/zinc-dependent alcohol dehydrogenase-like family protein [Dactylosporangium cerinum]